MNALRLAAGALAIAAIAACEELPPPQGPVARQQPADYRLPSRGRCREPRVDGEHRAATDAARAVAEALRGSPFPCVGAAVRMDGDRRVRLLLPSRCDAGDMAVEGEATVEITVVDGAEDAGAAVCAAIDASALRVSTRPRPDEHARPIDPATWLRREAPMLEGLPAP